MQFSYSTLSYALVWRNIIAFMHNITVYFAAIVLFVPHIITPWTLLAIPGMMIVSLNGVWISLLLHRPSEEMCNRFVSRDNLANSSAAFYSTSSRF